MAVALIVAAGRGERLGLDRPKALVTVSGRPMLDWSVAALRTVAAVSEIVVALPAEALDSAPPGCVAVAGGAVRSASVRAALGASGSGGDAGPVIVHDAARPLTTPGLFEAALSELERSGADAVVAAAPVTDTVKQVRDLELDVERTLERSRLWAVQTPQVFRREVLERVLAEASDELLAQATDDAWLVERAGGRVRILPSSAENLKVTTPRDLRLVESALARRAGDEVAPAPDAPGPRIPVTGIGYDCHQFAEDRALVLGGVVVPFERGLLGHSDADVLTHAVIDALLGAAGLGDIGQHFPDTDERYRGADSIALLTETASLVARAGCEVAHVDATVVLEAPRLAGFRDAMRERLAGALGVGVDRVSVKATRGEGMGFVGRGEGAAALALATLSRRVL